MESAYMTDEIAYTNENNADAVNSSVDSSVGSAALTLRNLIKAGFARPDAAREAIIAICENYDQCALTPTQLLQYVARVEDPDTAVQALRSIMQSQPTIIAQLAAISRNSSMTCALASLMQVLGASHAMGNWMRIHPNLIRAAANDPEHLFAMTREERCADLLTAIQAYRATVVTSEKNISEKISLKTASEENISAQSTSQEGASEKNNSFYTISLTTLGFAQAVSALRARYREHVAAIMSADLSSADPVEVQPDISSKLSDAADAALEAALAVARSQVAGSSACKFAIIAMGKLGAQEINYVSDIDLIYVVEPADLHNQDAVLRIGTSIAMVLQKVCQSVVMG